MGVCNVSLIISDKNQCKMFSDNSQNHNSSYNEDNIKGYSLTLSHLGKIE